MQSIHEHPTVEAAGSELLDFVLRPQEWLLLAPDDEVLEVRGAHTLRYQRRVGALRIVASVDVTDDLEVYLHIAFRSPGLTPALAADHLETFCEHRLPLAPNSEWEVEVDDRRWIHFTRPYLAEALIA